MPSFSANYDQQLLTAKNAEKIREVRKEIL
jgi:hypothetical protein